MSLFRVLKVFFFVSSGRFLSRKKGRRKNALPPPLPFFSLYPSKKTYLGTGADARCASTVRSDIVLDSLSARRDSSCLCLFLFIADRKGLGAEDDKRSQRRKKKKEAAAVTFSTPPSLPRSQFAASLAVLSRSLQLPIFFPLSTTPLTERTW